MPLEKRPSPSEHGQDATHLLWLNPLVLDLAIVAARNRDIQVKDYIEEMVASALALQILRNIGPDALNLVTHSNVSPWDFVESIAAERGLTGHLMLESQSATPVTTEVESNIVNP